ncbi:PhzF family phenazine biosynthesis protein [Azospirillum rugosum]|uniref:PhzF family phenazine biosynthesis protein n=1 Tax=Azospirillum rugosum TaxID=416170 RepID=A0ABS4SEE3_9PROT|nr:PhzF family phenazine biosynthesis protein [Azospirillum rugosum]MBP2290940.1 PhzF family phenazine biosynthesis protein [Azospirillum rugosum]MDQ0524996.1 PhzF family phenazine biosynthesis protein [Azospirillum rugosum]
MRLPIYQVDAFADAVFTGNPAAVVPLESWLPDETLQAIAMENNLAETAYFVRSGEGRSGDGYDLRWFTPTVEVDLCGHATLASAFVIATILEPGRERIDFTTRQAGVLTVTRSGDLYTLDFPCRPPEPLAEAPAGLLEALGGPKPVALLKSRDVLVVYEDAAAVSSLAPDMAALAKIEGFAVNVTAPGSGGVDFVSRFFAPGQGIPEDPVTGSAHCTLIPYWAARLGKDRLEARQISARGGALSCELAGDRVKIGGRGVLFLEGAIHI